MRIFLFLLPLYLFAAHIFVLHRIDDFRHPYTNTSSKELEKYILYLKNHNYKIVKLSTLIKLKNLRKNIDNYAVFTIDDSYKSFYKHGYPIFKKYNIPFTEFVYVEATEKGYGDFSSWNELKNMKDLGEFGVHSYSHPHLPKLTNQKIIEDTKKAVNIFEKHLGKSDMYAYPYGEYDDRVKKILSKYFPIICNQNVGAFDINSSNQDINRIALTGKVDIAKKLTLKNLYIKNLKIKIENNVIKRVEGDYNSKYLFIYITKLGWKKVKVNNNHFEYFPNFKLKKYRNRVIIRYNNKIISKMIVKGGSYE